MKGQDKPGRILVIGGESPAGPDPRGLLAARGHSVEVSGSQAVAREQLAKWDPEVILLDLGTDGAAGLEFLSELRQLDNLASLVVLTRDSDVLSAAEAMKRGADSFAPEPLQERLLVDVVERALERHRLQRRVRVYEERVSEQADRKAQTSEEIVGESPAMDRVRELVGQVATTEASVVLLGETGTGKSLTARAIHKLSKRAASPFVEVSCANLPQDLVESEIFGHEKGAFTGAVTRKPGLLEIAEGGSIFFDEIGDLQPSAQSKLLRAIEDRSFRRVGGTKEISVDVRIITATHQNLKRCVESGSFREDLFYRLSVFEITLPPLRDRGGDVLRLSEHFIGRLNPAVDHRIEGLSPGAARLLSNYDWPGNLRELRNVVERAMILARGPTIRPRDLPKNLTRSGSRRRDARLISLAEVERRHVGKVLEATGFNIQRTAKILGISRSTLYAKMKRFGLAARRGPRLTG